MGERLRVGLMVNSTLIPYWAYKMIDRINNGNYADIVLIIENGASRKPAPPIHRKITRKLNTIAYSVFARLDSMLRQLEPNPFAPMDITQILPDTSRITVDPIEKSFSDYITPADIEVIKSHSIDVLIRLGFRILRGEILRCAKFGVWSYHHGDNRLNRGGPPGFWEVLEGWPVTGSTLQILTEDLDGGIVLYRSYSQTDVLLTRNNGKLYSKSLSFLPRKLEQLASLGEAEFFRRVNDANAHIEFYSRRLYKTPRNVEMLKLILKHYSWYCFAQAANLVFFKQWILLWNYRKDGSISSSFWRFKKIVPPKDRFWADPCVVFQNGKHYVFMEELLYATNKGHIACLSIDKDGHHSTPIKVLERPYHLSYPFVFLHNGDYYMVPETRGNQTIELYRCKRFPDTWEFVNNLKENVCAYDTTLLHKDGIWWMFTLIMENEGATGFDELFLFYSRDLFTDDWKSHPNNPVVSDARSGRPAGRIFSYNGNLYRPSQNNGKSYGYGMKINQIKTISEIDYEEICVNEIQPLWEKHLYGTHTLDFAHGMTVADALKGRWKYFG